MPGKKIYPVSHQDLKSITFKVHKNIHEILKGKKVQEFLFKIFGRMWGDLTATRQSKYNDADLKLLDMLLDPEYAISDIEKAMQIFHDQIHNPDKPAIYLEVTK